MSHPDPGSLATSDQTPMPARPKKPRRAVRLGNETEVVLGASHDELDDPVTPTSGGTANDERLKREVPPHW